MKLDARNAAILICFFAVILSALTQKPLEIRVMPHILQSGGSVRVSCRVEPHENNRWLRFGIEGYTESLYELEGRESPITTERVFSHVPCGSDTAYCELVRNDGWATRATEQVVVSGCEQSTR